ncbi:MAG: PKD domain-containing protein, partial [Chloroflexota bacterium]|nr:PKD domain-containing protein [Chloroflexota bacterium]
MGPRRPGKYARLRVLLSIPVLFGLLLTALVSIQPSAQADHVPAEPQTLTYNVTFSASGQSVWGPGATSALPTKTVNLFSTSWNDSDTQSDIESFAGLDFGGEVGGGSSGQLGLEARFSDIGPGAVNVNYPVQIKMDVPAIDSFRTGQIVSIGSNWTLQPGSSMSVSIPRGRVSIDGDMAVAANAFFNVCFFGCSGRSDFFPPINLSYLNQPVASSDGLTLQIAGETVPGQDYINQKQISSVSSFITGIGGVFAPPDLQLTTVVGPDGKSLIASGTSPNFIDMDINFTKFLKKLPGGQVLGVSLPPVAPGVALSAEVFDADSFIKVSQNQRVVFTPTVRVTMQFPQAVQYTVKTPAGAVVASGNAAAITYDVGNKLDIVAPSLANGATLTATPTFTITNTFTNNGTTVYDQNLVLDVLKLKIQTPEVEVIPSIVVIPGGCIDYLFGEECWDDVTTPALVAPAIAVSEGPVYRETHPLYSTTDTGIITGNQASWQLGGFVASAGAAFVLNPQYTPLASVTGPSTLNEGQQGTYTFTLSDADVVPTTLTYTYNWGDGSPPVTGAGAVGGKTFTDNHTYADNGAYTINLTVSDTHKVQGAASKTVTVNNVAPVLTHSAAASINENGILAVSGAITDPGIRDSFTLTVTWGEGGNEVYVYPAGTTSYSISHLYLDDNPTNMASDIYPISLTLKDKDNATDVKSRTVTVNNVAPTVFAGNNRTVDEGSPTVLGIDLFGKNLIANPNAEAGADGWTASGGFTAKT